MKACLKKRSCPATVANSRRPARCQKPAEIVLVFCENRMLLHQNRQLRGSKSQVGPGSGPRACRCMNIFLMADGVLCAPVPKYSLLVGGGDTDGSKANTKATSNLNSSRSPRPAQVVLRDKGALYQNLAVQIENAAPPEAAFHRLLSMPTTAA